MTLPNAGLKGRHWTVVPSRGAAIIQAHSLAGGRHLTVEQSSSA